MTKKYNLGKHSDMRKFAKDLKREITKEAKMQVLNGKYNIICPACSNNINVPVGKSVCPICGGEIDLHLNIDF